MTLENLDVTQYLDTEKDLISSALDEWTENYPEQILLFTKYHPRPLKHFFCDRLSENYGQEIVNHYTHLKFDPTEVTTDVALAMSIGQAAERVAHDSDASSQLIYSLQGLIYLLEQQDPKKVVVVFIDLRQTGVDHRGEPVISVQINHWRDDYE